MTEKEKDELKEFLDKEPDILGLIDSIDLNISSYKKNEQLFEKLYNAVLDAYYKNPKYLSYNSLYSSIMELIFDIQPDILNYIKNIGKYMFLECMWLTELTIPNNIESIGQGAFQFCNNLMYINLSKNLKSIDDNAFEHCVNLVDLTIPKSVKKLGDEIISATWLNDLYYEGTMKEWFEIYKSFKFDLNSVLRVVHCIDGDVKVR